MFTKDDLNNILFFLNNSTISGHQAVTLAVLQTKITNMLKVMEVTDPDIKEKEENVENINNNKEEK